jgi:hypothetical protein
MQLASNASESTSVWRPAGSASTALPVRGSFTRDEQFLDLLAAYRGFGGLARFSEFAWRRPRSGLWDLDRAIVSRDVISLDWGENRWLPVCQFEPGNLVVRNPIRILIADLSIVLDDWDLAAWFVEPHTWLGGAVPLEVVDSDFARLHNAALALLLARRNWI